MKVAFIVGSPRSGTTILGNILNFHPEIAEWYEPYYLWERYFPSKENDVWQEDYLDDRTKQAIHKEFRLFSKKSRKSVVLDKSPGHVFNLRIINKIFPEAKWIHILRDGRDVTLSIRREWHKRSQIVKRRDFLGLLRVAANMLQRQPYWRYRFMALTYELSSDVTLNPIRYLNKSKWKGQVGWGPRFEGWKEYLQIHSSLEFNAMQWVKSVEAVQENWPILPRQNKLEIRYEDLLTFPKDTLNKVLNLLEVEATPDFFSKIPKLKRGNFNKWKREFIPEELAAIRPILDPLLNNLGYVDNEEWQDPA